MARVAKKPIDTKEIREFFVDDKNVLRVSGARGSLSLALVSGIEIVKNEDEGKVVVNCNLKGKTGKELGGTYRALIANIVKGVTNGFTKTLKIVGVGYRVNLTGDKLNFNLGFSHPVIVLVPSSLKVSVPDPTTIVVSGNDVCEVGQYCANIRKLRPPEPYKGKGVRLIDEVVLRKSGKTGKK